MAQPLEVPMTKPISELSDIELREAVAVEVMGLMVVRCSLKCGDYYPNDRGSYLAYQTAPDSDFFGLPRYESSIEAAFEAIDKARTKNCYVEVIAMGFGYLIIWQAFGDVSDGILDAGTIKVKFLSEVPRAICIATLTAICARKA